MSSKQGQIYIVATPIGNLGDISKRAVKTLTKVDIVFSEDTRNTRKLLSHYGIQQKLASLHEHNEAEKTQEILSLLAQGKQIAVVSDAGTPLISDPGYKLVKTASQQGFRITPIPGASAIITALSIAGLPTERFCFEGFLPSKASARRNVLEKNKHETRTQVYYESSHRIANSINDICDIYGQDREIVLARELTKLYEDVFRGTLKELKRWISEKAIRQKGEFVLVINGFITDKASEAIGISTQQLLNILTDELPIKQAASLAAKITGQAKNKLYKQAMAIKEASLFSDKFLNE